MEDDWDKPTVLRKSRPSTKDSRTSAAVNKAMASGNVEIHKKSMCDYTFSVNLWSLLVTAGGNKQHAGPAISLAKLEQETEEFKGKCSNIEALLVQIIVATVEKSVSRAIIDGRQQKGMTQKELATVLRFTHLPSAQECLFWSNFF